MDILTNKSKKNYEYVSRYANFYYSYNTLDKKYIYELTKHLKEDLPYVLIDVDTTTTLDGLANKYYGRPDYFWVIADFNKIKDPFIQLSDYYTQLKLPSISAIEYEE